MASEKEIAAMTKIVRLRVRGRVQGVGFRYFVERQADRLGLDGWVRNCRDGSVEAVATGPADKIEALIAQCRTGPEGSRVDQVEVDEADADLLNERPAGLRFATLPTR
jgi:acylphosphatase